MKPKVELNHLPNLGGQRQSLFICQTRKSKGRTLSVGRFRKRYLLIALSQAFKNIDCTLKKTFLSSNNKKTGEAKNFDSINASSYLIIMYSNDHFKCQRSYISNLDCNATVNFNLSQLLVLKSSYSHWMSCRQLRVDRVKQQDKYGHHSV